MAKQQTELMMRYSPKPRAAYIKIVVGHAYGAATSALLDKPEIWNLAYLSHDYENKVDHVDPNFTTHVRRSCQMKLDGTGLGIGLNPSKLVASMLTLPAPRFVYLIKRHKILATLPLFITYGQEWLTMIEERSRLCTTEDAEGEATTDESIRVTSELMAKLMTKTK